MNEDRIKGTPSDFRSHAYLTRRKNALMAILLTETNGGRELEVRAAGKLMHADYEHFVPEFERDDSFLQALHHRPSMAQA